MDPVFFLLSFLELMLWLGCGFPEHRATPRRPPPPDRWTPPEVSEIARAVGWPANPPKPDPLWDRELDG